MFQYKTINWLHAFILEKLKAYERFICSEFKQTEHTEEFEFVIFNQKSVFVPSDKTPEELAEEEKILQQMIEVVDMRDSLVSFLEEKRLKEMSEEMEAFTLMEAKRHSKMASQVHWA